MANMSNYLEKKLLNHIFRGTPFTPPPILYVALLTETIDDSIVLGSDLPEVPEPADPSAEGAYVRKGVPSSAAKWADPALNDDGIIKNVEEIKWERVAWEEQIVGIAFCDTAEPKTGNVLFWADLLKPKDVTPEDSISFAAEAITIQIDNDKA